MRLPRRTAAAHLMWSKPRRPLTTGETSEGWYTAVLKVRAQPRNVDYRLQPTADKGVRAGFGMHSSTGRTERTSYTHSS